MKGMFFADSNSYRFSFWKGLFQIGGGVTRISPFFHSKDDAFAFDTISEGEISQKLREFRN
jgi:hypothetical protein